MMKPISQHHPRILVGTALAALLLAGVADSDGAITDDEFVRIIVALRGLFAAEDTGIKLESVEAFRDALERLRQLPPDERDALRGAMARSERPVHVRTAVELTDACLADCIEQLGDHADNPSTDQLKEVLPGIVERHGGKIWAEGSPGRGAAFFFRLPVPPADGVGGAPASSMMIRLRYPRTFSWRWDSSVVVSTAWMAFSTNLIAADISLFWAVGLPINFSSSKIRVSSCFRRALSPPRPGRFFST